MSFSPECLYRSGRSEAWRANSLVESDVDVVLGGRKADALIFDGPFSARTHEGHKNGTLTADRAGGFARTKKSGEGVMGRTRERAYAARVALGLSNGRRELAYEHWTPTEVRRFCDVWVPRSNGWVVSLTDDMLAPAWRTSFVRHGLYPFAPLPLIETGSRCRMTGDGPSNWTCWIVVARPRSRAWASWGTLRGAYIQPGDREINSRLGSDRIVGGKPMESMIAIVKDYSREGSMVVDPTAGGFTTGLACLRSGRLFIGLECDGGRAQIGADRLRAEEQHSDRLSMVAGQVPMFGGAK